MNRPAIPDEFSWITQASGWVAAIISCTVPFSLALPPAQMLGYLFCALLYLGLIGQAMNDLDICSADDVTQTWRIPARFVLLGLLCTGLLLFCDNLTLQPMAFSVPFVQAVLLQNQRLVLWVAALYTFLMLLGLWMAGAAEQVLPITAVYAMLFLFLYAFVHLGNSQGQARRRADALAADLALQRDAAAALAAENARLYQQAKISATLSERNRIARELHDTIAQGLTATCMQLEAAQRSFDRDASRTRQRLDRAAELAHQTLRDVRQSVWMLASPMAEAQSLRELLTSLSDDARQQHALAIEYQHDGPDLELSSEQQFQLLRIVQEALQNVRKHAHAQQVWLRSELDQGDVRVQIRDDGRGFDPNQVQRSAEGGFGLLSMQERCHILGGHFAIQSDASGSLVEIRFPQQQEAAA
jgi:signal transduction histidine kinase